MNSYNIAFPLQDDLSSKSFLLMNRVTKDAYRSDLMLLLLTQKGERYYEPDYGTDLLKYIFEPNDNMTSVQIEEEIKNTVALYLPQLRVTSITFNWNFDDQGNPISDNQLNVNIKFVYSEGILNEADEVNISF